MKTLWEEMSRRVEKLEIVNEQNIMEMTQQKYTNKFSKIMFYESLGSVICYVSGIYLLINIAKLDTWYLMLCGIFTIVFLLLLPVFSLRSLSKLKRLDLTNYSYTETVVRFAKSKRRVLLLQRAGVYLSLLLFLTILPVTNKIFNNKDMFIMEMEAFPWIFVGIVFVVLIFFVRWGYGCYKSITESAENVLKELED